MRELRIWLGSARQRIRCAIGGHDQAMDMIVSMEARRRCLRWLAEPLIAGDVQSLGIFAFWQFCDTDSVDCSHCEGDRNFMSVGVNRDGHGCG